MEPLGPTVLMLKMCMNGRTNGKLGNIYSFLHGGMDNKQSISDPFSRGTRHFVSFMTIIYQYGIIGNKRIVHLRDYYPVAQGSTVDLEQGLSSPKSVGVLIRADALIGDNTVYSLSARYSNQTFLICQI